MKKTIYTLLLILTAFLSFAQIENQISTNAAEQLIATPSDLKLVIGGYGQIDFNQPLNKDIRSNGNLDVHRMVMLFGYKFNNRISFVTELELEHVKEIYVEQAFIQYTLKPWLNFKAGLMLVPMGIINEYHEPVTFNGVERPGVDSRIVPTTWRELGAGFSGQINSASIKYQLYIMNGFKSYSNETGMLDGKNGLRKGRQKGAESMISYPSLAARIDYFGIPGLKTGFSVYSGKTQSDLYNGIDKNNKTLLTHADSSVVGVTMIGMDARYNIGGLAIRGQYILGNINNTEQYNAFTGNDLGSNFNGYYGEIAFDILRVIGDFDQKLNIFARYERYNTQAKTNSFEATKAFDISEIVTGIGYEIAPGAMLKTDLQFKKSEDTNKWSKQFNAGVAVWF